MNLSLLQIDRQSRAIFTILIHPLIILLLYDRMQQLEVINSHEVRRLHRIHIQLILLENNPITIPAVLEGIEKVRDVAETLLLLPCCLALGEASPLYEVQDALLGGALFED
jgi:hypothetical protein